MAENLEKKLPEYISQDAEGKTIVDWKALAELSRAGRYGAMMNAELILDHIFQALKQKGVLVYEGAPNSFFALEVGVPLHPSGPCSIVSYNFFDEENARQFYANFYAKRKHRIDLVKVIGRIEKVEAKQD